MGRQLHATSLELEGYGCPSILFGSNTRICKIETLMIKMNVL